MLPRRKRRPQIRNQKQIPSEYQECKAFWEWAQLIPLLKDLLIKNTNEHKSDQWFITALLSIGMRKGLPDYHLPYNNGTYSSLWLEFKRSDRKGKATNPDQDVWIDKLTRYGHYACYVYSCDEAIIVCNKYIQNLL